MSKKLLVVVAHPDDAEICAGGTIAKATCRGWQAIIMPLSAGEPETSHVARRSNAAHQAAVSLGASLRWEYAASFNQVSDRSEVEWVGEMDRMFQEIDPDLVITHCSNDSHVDHRLVCRVVEACSRRHNWSLVHMPPSDIGSHLSLQFTPNLFIEITEFVSKKMTAIEHYNYEADSFRALDVEKILQWNRTYGVNRRFEYAEAFTAGALELEL